MQSFNVNEKYQETKIFEENQKPLQIPRIINIADPFVDNFHSVVLRNITSPQFKEFKIEQGLVLKESMIVDFLKTDVKFDPNKDSQSSLIYSLKYGNMPVVIGVNVDRNGVFEKIKDFYELEKDQQYYFGFPAGENLQLVDVQEDKILINNQSYKIEEGLSVILVKSPQQKLKQYQQQVIEDPSKCSSRVHAQIIVKDGKIFIYDGFDNHKSQNGVWLSIVHQKLSLNGEYCFRDFRLLLKVKY